jgi:cell division transport system permease protein
MSLPRHIFAPAFQHERLSWSFAALVGILVFVASFAMAVEATLSAISFTWDRGIEQRMTVEIPAVDDESATPQSERVTQTLNVLHAIPDLTLITLLPDDQVGRLLKPWINQPDVLKVIPLPSLIDIEKKPGSALTSSDVEAKLKGVVSDAHVDDHAAWLADMRHLVFGLATLAGLTIALTGITLLIVVNIMCRAIMATEDQTVMLLHSMGAEDNDIAANFQYHAQRVAGPAAWAGFALALAAAIALIYGFRHVANPTSLQLLHWVGLAAATLLVPLAAIAVAALAAKRSTLKYLRSVP